MKEHTEPTQRRLFLALWPSVAALTHASEGIGSVRGTSPQSLRWQPPDRWHVTVVFLGDCDDERERAVVALSERHAADVSPDPTRIRGSGCFGSVLWLGIETGSWLTRLAQGLSRDLLPHGERQRLRPHLTVARDRSRRPNAARQAARALRSYEGPQWHPHELTLVSSVLGPAPRYTIRQRFPLRTLADRTPR